MKSRFSYLLAAGAAVMMLTGCSKKMGQFQADYFSVNPNPLAVKGQTIPANINGKVPAKFFAKNAEVTVTPYLVYDGTEQAATPMVLQGEKVRGNNPTISYADGGTFTIPVNYLYQPEMMRSELQLGFNVKQGGQEYVLPRVTVANGVNATATLVDVSTVTPALAPDKFQKDINEKYTADIKFVVGQSNVRDSELKSEGMQAFNKTLRDAYSDSTRVIEEINISSYASPEGSLALNTRLAENREKNTESYLRDQFKKDKIAEFGELTSQFTPEDWEGFQELLAKSDIQDKELILSVLQQFQDPEEREKEMRNLATVFNQVADQILPQLRRSRLTATVKVLGRTDEQIANQYTTDPSQLSVDELLYCATLTNNPDMKKAIYSTVTRLYPNDYRAYNNLGMIQYQQRDFDAAQSSFAKAMSLAPTSAEAQMNNALMALRKGDYNTAERSLGGATSLKESKEALGVYNLMKGDVAAANRLMTETASNNASLAKILNNDLNSAQKMLNQVVNPDATTYYLKAIVGARTGNASTVAENLKKAIRLDDSFATRALNDLEFVNYNVQQLLN